MCSGSNLTMEDKLGWTDCVSAYALYQAGVDDEILEMWGHLRKATIYFMRFQHNQHKEEYICEAQECLLQYAKMVQEAFGTRELMTFQLHTCMAHIADQKANDADDLAYKMTRLETSGWLGLSRNSAITISRCDCSLY